MRRAFVLWAVLATITLTAGCSNPYIDPEHAAAIHDREISREMKKQTEIMEKQTALLERIAIAEEKQAASGR